MSYFSFSTLSILFCLMFSEIWHLKRQLILPASCGSLQDLTNPDFCGVGVLASYTVGAVLVILHQIGFAILECIAKEADPPQHQCCSGSLKNSGHARAPDPHTPDTRSSQLSASVAASSISLFETTMVLAVSWQFAALLSLNSTFSVQVQTTHDVLLVCLTSCASVAIVLGALSTSFDHIRRHKFRVVLCLLSLALCAAVTGMAQSLMVQDDFPKEICLPFFNDYMPKMRKYFVVLSATFWTTSIIMVAMIGLSFTTTQEITTGNAVGRCYRRVLNCLIPLRLYITVVVELLLLIMIVLVNHYWIPESVLRAQAGGQLAESQWTFGQIVGMLIWLPVLTEFVFVLAFGPKEGLEGRLPTGYAVCCQTSEIPPMQLSSLHRISVGNGNGVSRNGNERFYQVLQGN